MEKIEIFAISITNSCNLNCRFCSREAKNHGVIHLPKDKIIEIIIELISSYSPRVIAISGGEPLCHPNFFEIISELKKLGLNLRMNSNCTLIDKSIAKRLKKNGINNITISIDSLDPNINHKIGRGINYIDKIKKAIFYLKKNNINFFIKSTLNRENILEAPKIMKFAKDIGAIGYALGKTIPIGRGIKFKNDYLLSWKEYKKTCEICSTNVPNRFQFLIDDPLKFLLDSRISSLLQKFNFDCKTINSGCSAGKDMLYIKPNGEVLSCPGVALPVGNIFNQSLKEIWEKSDVLNTLRDRGKLKGKCGKCIKKNICGGCRGAAYSIYKDIMAEDPSCPYNIEKS